MRNRIIRLCTGIPLVISIFFLGLPALILVVLGAIILSFDMVDFICYIFTDLLLPKKESPPTPMYGIPESLAARGKYIEAELEYEKIIENYPNEIKPHIDMINIAVMYLEDGDLAEKLHERGITLLSNEEARNTLTKMYNSIRTRLK